ncbi:JID1 [Candida pseudojiufengensis]|uniref:JID1 n=1 Tax=Candida pseudojiufengensis TaxID=497109 RepID=UPI002223F261|nr:JID1 [Candida pseudojiufengensis]KAI5964575.1 JID1 [Candida pseudojiufengensis]
MLSTNTKYSNNLKRICYCQCKRYATSIPQDDHDHNQPMDHHKRLNLHEWPKTKNPTPYEIFGLSSKDIGMSTIELNKIIKLKYIKFVKIYHPDTSLKHLDSSTSLLTDDIKRKRYEMIQESYDILRDARRRSAYNRFKTTSWDQQGPYNPTTNNPWSKENFETYRRANAHRSRYDFKKDEEFWTAGTWNDYYQMKYQRSPPTKEEMEKNKYKILIGVLAVGALAFGLQFMNAIDKTNQYILDTHKLNLKSMKDLNESYSNGYGSDKIDDFSQASTIKRFLLSRRSTMQSKRRSEGDGDDPFELNNKEPSDHELLVKYARGKVNKWDKAENDWNQSRIKPTMGDRYSLDDKSS